MKTITIYSRFCIAFVYESRLYMHSAVSHMAELYFLYDGKSMDVVSQLELGSVVEWCAQRRTSNPK